MTAGTPESGRTFGTSGTTRMIRGRPGYRFPAAWGAYFSRSTSSDSGGSGFPWTSSINVAKGLEGPECSLSSERPAVPEVPFSNSAAGSSLFSAVRNAPADSLPKATSSSERPAVPEVPVVPFSNYPAGSSLPTVTAGDPAAHLLTGLIDTGDPGTHQCFPSRWTSAFAFLRS
jgi:hypothetical protein